LSAIIKLLKLLVSWRF